MLFRKLSNAQHHNPYYMYSLSGFGNTFWLISNQVHDPTFLLAGFEENATCPDSKKLLLLLLAFFSIKLHTKYQLL